ncbi:hypothetical protein EI94DRAFT_1749605, partial [Lactarius quietus]
MELAVCACSSSSPPCFRFVFVQLLSLDLSMICTAITLVTCRSGDHTLREGGRMSALGWPTVLAPGRNSSVILLARYEFTWGPCLNRPVRRRLSGGAEQLGE